VWPVEAVFSAILMVQLAGELEASTCSNWLKME
jgi:hypothetical protein